MTAPDSSVPDPQQPPKPRRRDARLDARPPGPGAQQPSRPAPLPRPQSTPPAPPPVIEAEELVGSVKRPARSQQVWIASGVGLLVVLAIVGAVIFFNNRTSQDPGQLANNQDKRAQPNDGAPASELRQPAKPLKCRILTPEPGFVAFVDEEAVRDDDGKLVMTPCEVLVEKGAHMIRVAKKGWNDTPRKLDVSDDMDVEQQPVFEPFAALGTTFSAPYLNAEVGKPILLEVLMFKGRIQDPVVSPDGCQIWYAAAGSAGTGIYYSTRTTSYDEWDAPSLLELSRGTMLPASPSAANEGLLVGYTIPGKTGQVWGLSRKAPEEAFDAKKVLHHLEHGESEWPSAQLSADGRRLYWLESRDGKHSTWVASRDEPAGEFGEKKKVSLPGGHPCLSSDELRQYLFDGKQLSRARRTSLTKAFGTPQVIAEVNLPAYVPHPERRQFWVTEDEQWLYYAEDPNSSSNLFVVRLSLGRGRGVAVRGKALKPDSDADPDTVAKSNMPEKSEILDATASPAKPEVDPLSLPTPYAAARQKLSELLAKRNTAGALQLIAEERQKPELQGDRQLLEWDAAEVTRIQTLWQTIEAEVLKLKAGDTLRIGGSGFTFEKYADGVLVVKAKTKTVERKLTELAAGELLVLADKSIPKTDPAGQLAIGTFLHYEGKAQAQATKVRLERAGDAGAEFRERLAVRKLKIIEHELARENLGTALRQVDELVAEFPQSPSAVAAEEHRKKIYSYVKWEMRGPRKWGTGPESAYEATAEKKVGSLLVSAAEYDSFDLSLEWKITSSTGLGGVYFRYPGQGKALETAFKLQLANDAGVAPDKFCTGSLFNYNPPTENAARAGQQWSTLRMQVRGEKVTVILNDKKVMETLATDPAVPLRGYVALDGEYGGIIYRKILLVEGPKIGK